jgi:hypothetical protein
MRSLMTGSTSRSQTLQRIPDGYKDGHGEFLFAPKRFYIRDIAQFHGAEASGKPGQAAAAPRRRLSMSERRSAWPRRLSQSL